MVNLVNINNINGQCLNCLLWNLKISDLAHQREVVDGMHFNSIAPYETIQTYFCLLWKQQYCIQFMYCIIFFIMSINPLLWVCIQKIKQAQQISAAEEYEILKVVSQHSTVTAGQHYLAWKNGIHSFFHWYLGMLTDCEKVGPFPI